MEALYRRRYWPHGVTGKDEVCPQIIQFILRSDNSLPVRKGKCRLEKYSNHTVESVYSPITKLLCRRFKTTSNSRRDNLPLVKLASEYDVKIPTIKTKVMVFAVKKLVRSKLTINDRTI